MTRAAAQVRVATLNLASGRPASTPAGESAGTRAEGALLSALAPLGQGGLGVDVLALQEVDVAQPRSHGVDQAAVAAEALGVGADGVAFAPAILGTPSQVRDWSPAPPTVFPPAIGPDPQPPASSGLAMASGQPMYGVALVSRLPVLRWHVLRMPGGLARLPLPVQDPASGRTGVLLFPDEPRVALAAELDAGPLGRLTVVCTHLSFWPLTALRQLWMLRRWVADIPGPVVLAGDLNLPGSVAGRVFGGDALSRHHTYPAAHPRAQIDHLLLRRAPAPGLLHEPAGSVLLNVSDHRALAAALHR